MAQINRPSDYFNTKLWTGDNTDRTISGVGFQPDWVWWKQRNGTDDHRLLDSVRGEGGASYKLLFSSGTYAEFDGNDNGGGQGNINAITSDGFSGVQGTTGWNNWNGSGLNYVGWNWLGANGTSANTDGSIASTVSANTTSGFSIVSFTGNGSGGATVGHGLGVAPAVVIAKPRQRVEDWRVYHKNVGAGYNFVLNETSAPSLNSTIWNNTAPSSTLVTLGSNTSPNPPSETCILYCFAEKKGYSKFGSYVGNGSTTDNAFIYTGFKPSWFMCKRTDGAGIWAIFDNKRETFNDGANSNLAANSADAENVNDYNVEFFSNGIKPNASSDNIGRNGASYIYMAFAENPLVGTNNIPATAR